MISSLAWAAEPASLFQTSLTTTPWVIGIRKESLKFGKIKIFNKKPVYDPDGNLSDSPAMLKELREPGDTLVLSKLKTKYWIIFYPKYGLLNLTALFYKGKDDSTAAKFNVKKLVSPLPAQPGCGSMNFEVKLTDTQAFKFINPNVDNFEAFDGDLSIPEPSPLFTLN